jgi:3-deoxy-D-manno-octulosonic-acid transferase
MLARKAAIKWDELRAKWPGLRRGGGPLFIAGSTHSGEDDIVLDAFGKVRRSCPEARLILAPRHPKRALYAVASSLPKGEVALLSELEAGGQSAVGDWDVMVVNSIGKLFDLYACVSGESDGGAGGAFVGGSLIPKGGQNPMEPALFGLQVTHGPDMSDFPDTKLMDASGAAVEVRDAAGLAEAWLNAMDQNARNNSRLACQNYFASTGNAASRCWDIIKSRSGL